MDRSFQQASQVAYNEKSVAFLLVRFAHQVLCLYADRRRGLDLQTS